MRNEFADKFVRDKTNDNADGKGKDAEDQRIRPLRTIQPMNVECATSNKDDQDLSSNDDKLYSDEVLVAEHSFEDVELVVETAGATPVSMVKSQQGGFYSLPLIEYLHENKCIEDECLKLVLFRCGVIRQQRLSSEI